MGEPNLQLQYLCEVIGNVGCLYAKVNLMRFGATLAEISQKVVEQDSIRVDKQHLSKHMPESRGAQRKSGHSRGLCCLGVLEQFK